MGKKKTQTSSSSNSKKNSIKIKEPKAKQLQNDKSLEDAIAIGKVEILKGASDQQISQSLQDAGLNLKRLPPDFLAKLRGGSSFKPKPIKPTWRGKSK